MRRLPVVRFMGTVLLLTLARVANSQPIGQPPTAQLLKRIAEAVDGNRNGGSVFVVASYDSMNPVRGVFPTREAASRLAARLGRSYDVFGPFRTILDPPSAPVISGCVHEKLTSYMDPICPQTPFIAVPDIEQMTLVVRTRSGRVHELPISRDADAIFLSLPAIDKFVIPYYSRIIGVDSAAAMRARIASRIPVR